MTSPGRITHRTCGTGTAIRNSFPRIMAIRVRFSLRASPQRFLCGPSLQRLSVTVAATDVVNGVRISIPIPDSANGRSMARVESAEPSLSLRDTFHVYSDQNWTWSVRVGVQRPRRTHHATAASRSSRYRESSRPPGPVTVHSRKPTSTTPGSSGGQTFSVVHWRVSNVTSVPGGPRMARPRLPDRARRSDDRRR